ncbi:MAG TPA: hypothetical protein VI796_06485 [Candidatus Thermoplasmatota archaeon]|nr:hypothetical protein [Candidatus Thermoplasmatota archaeon]
MVSRWVSTGPAEPLAALVRHVKALTDKGYWVLLVTAKTPATVLQQAAHAAGVSPERLAVADAMSRPGGVGPAAGDGKAIFVQAPSLLELLLMRAEKVVWGQRAARTHIIVHDINTFALYNPPQAIEQMARYLMGRVRSYTTVDFLVDPRATLPSELRSFFEGFCPVKANLDSLPAPEPAVVKGDEAERRSADRVPRAVA